MFCAIQKYSLSQWPFVTGYQPLRWDRRVTTARWWSTLYKASGVKQGLVVEISHRKRRGRWFADGEFLQQVTPVRIRARTV